jgi:hypothetical protein
MLFAAESGMINTPVREAAMIQEVERHQSVDPSAGHDHVPEGHEQLQDLLPEIKNLALRVGGMKQLADIVACLAKGD